MYYILDLCAMLGPKVKVAGIAWFHAHSSFDSTSKQFPIR